MMADSGQQNEAGDTKAAKQAAKAAKKVAKNAVKAQKKDAFARPSAGGAQAPTSPSMTAFAKAPSAEPSPAERSARAAEHNLILQNRRVIVSVAALIVAIIGVLLALWSGSHRSQPPVPAESTVLDALSPDTAKNTPPNGATPSP